MESLINAQNVCRIERERQDELEQRRALLRIGAETAARQRGESIAETEVEGRKAAEEIVDEGPADPVLLEAAEALLDEHTVDGALWLVRKCSDLRWVHQLLVGLVVEWVAPKKQLLVK